MPASKSADSKKDGVKTVANNIMLDIETLGTSPGAAIMSIGAVRFAEDVVTDKFMIAIKIPSLIKAGFSIDDDTFLFWLQQDAAAVKQFMGMRVDVDVALDMFAGFVGRDAIMWGNGAGFDNVLLRQAYHMTGRQPPWQWSNDRCYRTIKKRCPSIEVERVGTPHNALDDATTQALHLIKCLKCLTIAV